MSGSEAENEEYQRKLRLQIYTLWNMNVFDTLEIAKQLKLPEYRVYNIIGEMQDDRPTRSPE